MKVNVKGIRAYKDTVIAAILEVDTGSIVMPDNVKTSTNASLVLDVGPDFKGDAHGKVKKGDIVFCKMRYGLERKLDKRPLVIIEEAAILAVISAEQAFVEVDSPGVETPQTVT